MKVEVGSNWSAVDAVQSALTDATRSKSGDKAAATESDNAQLSNAAVLASDLHRRLDGVSESRQARVNELKQRVEQGAYAVSSEQIATALRNDLGGLQRVYKGRS